MISLNEALRVGAGNRVFSLHLFSNYWCIFIQTLHNAVLHHVAAIDGGGPGVGAEADQLWVRNGHRQVRQNGSSAVVRPHLTSSMSECLGMAPKGKCWPQVETKPTPPRSHLSILTKLTDLSGHRGHPVPASKFRLSDVIPAEKITVYNHCS